MNFNKRKMSLSIKTSDPDSPVFGSSAPAGDLREIILSLYSVSSDRD